MTGARRRETEGCGMETGKIKSGMRDLTKGPIVSGMIAFIIPMFLGQLLQQFYNLADAWVVGNFADNNVFAAVGSSGSITFMLVGFFNGIAVGGGVTISRFFGAKDRENTVRAVHSDFLFGLIASVLATAAGLLILPFVLDWMRTPAEVMPYARTYLAVYFGGIGTVILYNICMGIMQALGDSVHPLYYLGISSVTNVVLDLLFVAGFGWGAGGAASATVISQALSCVLCIIRLVRAKGEMHLDFRKLRIYPVIFRQLLAQGLPTGVMNSVISIGNIVVQTNINAFGPFAMSGHGAYSKIEGLVFLPIMCISMSMPTFISQNLGAREYARAKKGALIFTLAGVLLAELVGVVLYFGSPYALRVFTSEQEAVRYGVIHMTVTAPFFFLLSFSHCTSGILRGCGRPIVPMITMLSFWCGFRILYVTTAIRFFPVYDTIAWAYPITWTCSSVVLLIFLLKADWTHAFEKNGVRSA